MRAAKCRVAALDEQGLKTCFGERQRGEKAGASGADNDGALLGCVRRRGRGMKELIVVYRAYARAVTLGDAVDRLSLEVGSWSAQHESSG